MTFDFSGVVPMLCTSQLNPRPPPPTPGPGRGGDCAGTSGTIWHKPRPTGHCFVVQAPPMPRPTRRGYKSANVKQIPRPSYRGGTKAHSPRRAGHILRAHESTIPAYPRPFPGWGAGIQLTSALPLPCQSW